MPEASGTKWADHAIERLQDAGYRSGGARRQVVELLADESCALTALEIDGRLDSVGRASVYRALEQLEELKLVHRLDIEGGIASYERAEPSGDHHHHLVCERCGKVVQFEDRGLERAISAIARRSSFEVADHDVTLRGSCERCGAKTSRR